MAEESPPLLTVKEAAQRLGRDRSTVRRWVDQGYLLHVRMGQRRYIPGDEVERVLKGWAR